MVGKPVGIGKVAPVERCGNMGLGPGDSDSAQVAVHPVASIDEVPAKKVTVDSWHFFAFFYLHSLVEWSAGH